MRKLPPEHTDPMENLYRTSFDGFRAEPSEDLLSKIKSNLRTQQQSTSQGKLIFLWVIFSAVFLLVSFAGIYYYTQHNKQPLSSDKNKDTRLIKNEPLSPGILKEDKEPLNIPHHKADAQKNNIPVLRKNKQAILPSQESLVKTSDSTIQEQGVKNDFVEPVPQDKTDTEEEHDVDFYQKHTKSRKDSLRNLFDK